MAVKCILDKSVCFIIWRRVVRFSIFQYSIGHTLYIPNTEDPISYIKELPSEAES